MVEDGEREKGGTTSPPRHVSQTSLTSKKGGGERVRLADAGKKKRKREGEEQAFLCVRTSRSR